ncbi:Membrane-bound transcription factor site-1 protease [Toxocara canis]|uniref:Membrane-bound transcription factor site-1 protease n=1 Tax=Toxocara canis TaxID=6265 RepID=A0A0B2V3V4_TOXCA|nr:Membrane-bound transcription factor site-1 protease [Toxocara canis]
MFGRAVCLVAAASLVRLAAISVSCKSESKSFIVTFDGYYMSSNRLRSIVEAVGRNQTINVEQRPNRLSDFDVIEVSACNASRVVDCLRKSLRVRHVSPNVAFQAHAPSRRTLGRRGGTASLEIHQVTKVLNANKLWDMGFKGQGVKVAVFDTGLSQHHPHFRQIVERTDWTNEQTADDGLGHGTFVTGIIASSNKKCAGFAPAASIYVYKVFTKKQVSFTSWFLDAFNHAILRSINVLNLSIGGPDFTDLPFMDKVWELTANGVILISAIGNDGPKFGTLNNPADQMDVIGVGGINIDSKVARFSSRGMTTWELPGGYGRVKPDIVTFGASVYGSALDGGCRALSGTSVASPVVAGAVTVMLSGIDDHRLWNPAVVKQALVEGAVRLPNAATMFEQGAGRIDLLASFDYMRKYEPSITLIPPYIDFTECPYMWPYCSQPLYVSTIPTIVNVTIINGLGVSGRIVEPVTIINGLGVSGRIVEPPIWEPFVDENGDLLKISISYPDLLWPWSGYMAVAMSVAQDGKSYEGTAAGRITVTVTTDAHGMKKRSTATFMLRVRIIPTPPRSQRIIWDQYRNMRYPPGYLPRDDLRDRANPLDWTADHPHTNFKALYQHLRSGGYHIEVLGEPLTCVDLSEYAMYIVVDPEDEFFASEREKLYLDVVDAGLNLVVFADWFNATVIDKIRFLDENTKQWWQPETGGTNLPALNDLLSHWNITLGAQVFDGMVTLGRTAIKYSSGTSIVRTPPGSWVAEANLTDLGAETITGEKSAQFYETAVFTFYRSENISKQKPGFVAVFGDSTCLEVGTSVELKGCIPLLDALLESANEGDLSENLRRVLKPMEIVFPEEGSSAIPLPKRITTSNFAKYSKVISGFEDDGSPIFRPQPQCRRFPISVPHPVTNVTSPSDLNEERRQNGRAESFYDKIRSDATAAQFHELDQFFDANTDLDRRVVFTQTISILAYYNISYVIWGFIVVAIFAFYYRSSLRRTVLQIRVFRRVLRRLRIA